MASTEHFLKTSGHRCTFRLIMILEAIGQTAMSKAELPKNTLPKTLTLALEEKVGRKQEKEYTSSHKNTEEVLCIYHVIII